MEQAAENSFLFSDAFSCKVVSRMRNLIPNGYLYTDLRNNESQSTCTSFYWDIWYIYVWVNYQFLSGNGNPRSIKANMLFNFLHKRYLFQYV